MVKMGEDEQRTENPMELLRQLVEESGKWTSDLVRFARSILSGVAILSIFSLYLYARSILDYLSGEGSIVPLFIGIAVLALMAHSLRLSYRTYKSQARRRDRWIHKFEVLKKKEEEIEKLLVGEEAG